MARFQLEEIVPEYSNKIHARLIQKQIFLHLHSIRRYGSISFLESPVMRLVIHFYKILKND